MPEPRRMRQSYTRLMSVLMVVVGVALIARTIAAGGGALASGILLGVLFLLAGAGRLYVSRTR
jgi:Zn-dependent protease with chaperone function